VPKTYDAGADASLTQAKTTAALFKKLMMSVHHGHSSPVRLATHHGHKIEIKTSYEVKVDGKKLNIAFAPEMDGSVTYHAVPNRSFDSAVDLIRSLIDTFPEEFGKKAKTAPVHAHSQGVAPKRTAKKPKATK